MTQKSKGGRRKGAVVIHGSGTRDDIDVDIPKELTDRQRQIVRYRMRGLSQTQIAALFEVSQSTIRNEMHEIRKVFKDSGKDLDQETLVGESLNLYEEVKIRAWELYQKSVASENLSAANKALGTVMSSHERSLKLLMDLGIIKRAAIEHNLVVAPFLEKWNESTAEDRHLIASSVIQTQLSELEAPEPPVYEYAEFEEVDSDD